MQFLEEWGGPNLSNILTGVYFGTPGFNTIRSWKATFTIREPWAGAINTDQPFTCEEAFDPDVCASPGRYGSGQYSGVGAVTGTFEIGDVTLTYDEGSVYQYMLPPDDQFQYRIGGSGVANTQYNHAPISYILLFLNSAPNMGDSINYDWRSMDDETAASVIASNIASASGTINFMSDTGNAWGRLTPETLTIRTSVPEPATWALSIIGFGGVGSLVRRRRTAAKAMATTSG